MLGKIIGNSILRNFKLDRSKLHNYLFLLKSYANSTDAKTNNNNNLIRHNFHAECEEGINHQINQEFCVSYVYLYMSSIFSTVDVALHGFANYFREAAHEELKHGQMLIEYLNQRGGKLVLKEIGAPEKKDWSNPICAVQCSIDLEKQVTQSLEALHERGEKHKDHHLCDFIETYYLTEQYEAIKKLGDLLTNLKRAGPEVGFEIIDLELQKPKSKTFDLHSKNKYLVEDEGHHNHNHLIVIKVSKNLYLCNT